MVGNVHATSSPKPLPNLLQMEGMTDRWRDAPDMQRQSSRLLLPASSQSVGCGTGVQYKLTGNIYS